MVRLAARLGILILAAAACGTEPTPPGTLSIQLDAIDPIRTTTSLTVAGTVTREPVAEGVPTVVTLTMGTVVLDDTAAANGRFALSVTLPGNASTTLTLTATDGTGSTGTPYTLAVRHDDQLPAVVSVTPTDGMDQVAPPAIQATFTEPVRPGQVNVRLAHQGTTVPGTLVVAPDSLSVTFTPGAALVANAIHDVTISGILDEAGLAGPTRLSCFVTPGAQATFADGTADAFTAGTPGPGLLPLDLTEVRFAQTTSTLRGLLRFANARSFDDASPANVLAVVDLDLDQDSTTGVVTIKDTSFSGLLPRSGRGADYGIWLIPRGSPTDSSFVVQYTAPFAGVPTFKFVPIACANTIGFEVPRTALNGDDGAFDAVIYSDAFDSGGGYGDPAPDSAAFVVSLPAAVAAQPAITRIPAAGPLAQRVLDALRARWARFRDR